ncbi:transposase [Mycobacterium heckeshornense]|uniref:transposase n=1 Tax=Mycobacterium heckeshornense TaxID=110505 RepID=UPI0021F3A2DC|nr:transposase [Mycobacterium heckeshornense]MCV7033019.1 transposase [Mycobacterium heckeshornense]
MATRYDQDMKARAVRLVREHRDEYDTEWAAMRAISARLGMSAETLRKWVRQAESIATSTTPSGRRCGPSRPGWG